MDPRPIDELTDREALNEILRIMRDVELALDAIGKSPMGKLIPSAMLGNGKR